MFCYKTNTTKTFALPTTQLLLLLLSKKSISITLHSRFALFKFFSRVVNIYFSASYYTFAFKQLTSSSYRVLEKLIQLTWSAWRERVLTDRALQLLRASFKTFLVELEEDIAVEINWKNLLLSHQN